MTIEETYNIHKEINCTFPKFKSKWLCKKGIHNYRIGLKPTLETIPSNDALKQHIFRYKKFWKCYCCGKEVEWSEE